MARSEQKVPRRKHALLRLSQKGHVVAFAGFEPPFWHILDAVVPYAQCIESCLVAVVLRIMLFEVETVVACIRGQARADSRDVDQRVEKGCAGLWNMYPLNWQHVL